MSHYPTSSAPSSAGRHATHHCLHIRNATDAHIVFEAVRLNILPMIRRRLGPGERDLLRSGEVFVWEETDQKGGLERWTDGRRWSQSRMREPFLYYEEKEPTTREEREAKAARRAHRTADPSAPPVHPLRRQDRPSKPGGLTKQTFSSYVKIGSVSRKWHLVAYFNAVDYNRLPVVDDYDYLVRLRIPNGIYFSSKEVNSYSDNDDVYDEYRPSHRDRGSPSTSSSMPHSHASVPTLPPLMSMYTTTPSGHSRYHSGAHMRPTSTVSSTDGSTPARPHVYASHSAPFSTGANIPQTSQLPHAPSSSKKYVPLTSEDRRVLGAFRVDL